MTEATLTSKGQITLPKPIRDLLNVKPGDRIEFLVSDDGTVTVWPVTVDARTLKGLVPKPKRPVTVEEMNAAIRKRGGRS